MIDNNLSRILSRSVEFAVNKRHEYLTVEHVFYQILLSDKDDNIIEESGVDIEKMQEDLKDYIDANIDSIPKEIYKQDPEQSLALSRLVNQMFFNMANSGQEYVGIDDFIVALFEEKRTFSYMLLEYNEIDKLDILSLISHNELPADTSTQEKKRKENKSFLGKYTIDLIQKAQNGSIDPVLGRDKEIKRVMQILCRRRKNNPVLVGEAGVGKTAIAEGLALNIINDNVPQIIKDSKLFALDMSALLAGTKYRGDFEKRLKGVVDEIKSIDKSILFIDEIHTIIGAGATSGTMDAANQLKPSLANGEIKCMGATTFAEYRNGFEKDKALSRRFSKINIDEPSPKTSYKILQGIKEKYEKHHNIKYTNSALKTAIELSQRYITDRFLPDKAIDLIDETASSFHLKQNIKTKVASLDIEKTISNIIGISSSQISKDEIKSLANLENDLKSIVIGQDEAVNAVSKSIKISKAGLNASNKPIASFLFSGPTGVGKTELCIAISKVLGINFERFDMSEYIEKHALSRLVGAPPGYVGFEQGGLLTESIKKHPYTVLLLDEIEKAHPDITNILLQIMDNATLTDNNGYKANFQNVILIMTSNIGATARSVMGFNKDESLSKNEELKSFFSPEFRNRLDSIIDFNSLETKTINKIINKFTDELNLSLKKKKITVEIDKKAKKLIIEKSYSIEMGARPIKRYIQENITNKLSDEILFGKLINGGKVYISAHEKLIINIKKNNGT